MSVRWLKQMTEVVLTVELEDEGPTVMCVCLSDFEQIDVVFLLFMVCMFVSVCVQGYAPQIC